MVTDRHANVSALHWRRTIIVVGVAAFLVSLSACGGSRTSASAKSSSTSTTKLTFWDWSAGSNRMAEAFNKSHPRIQVTLEDVGAGGTEYTKIADALAAGSGAPDLAEIEYDELPSLEITHHLVDLAPYGAAKHRNDFVPWAWSEVTHGSHIWAFPDQGGPVALLYNSKLFDKYGLKVPETWADFAADAKKLHEANPTSYITNFAPADIQWVLTLMAQYGAFPFAYSGGSDVTIDFTGPKQTEFANYWDSLLANHYVNSTPDISPTAFGDMDNGTDATFISAGWGAQYMSADIKKTRGDWRSAPMPQWTAGEQVDGNWGGIAWGVLSQTHHASEAAQFALWLGATMESWAIQTSPPTLSFPAFLPELNSTSFASATLPLTGTSDYHKAFIESAKHGPAVEWPPFMTLVLTDSGTAFRKVMAGEESLKAAFADFQTTLVKYAKSEGFKVSTTL